MTKNCVICGKEFEAFGSAKACSDNCRKRLYREIQLRHQQSEHYRACVRARNARLRAMRTLVEKRCIVCGKELGAFGGAKTCGGACSLTETEKHVLKLYAEGASKEEISLALGRSVKTVEKHVDSCYAKLGLTVRRPVVLAHYAIRYGLAELKEFPDNTIQSEALQKRRENLRENCCRLRAQRQQTTNLLQLLAIGSIVANEKNESNQAAVNRTSGRLLEGHIFQGGLGDNEIPVHAEVSETKTK